MSDNDKDLIQTLFYIREKVLAIRAIDNGIEALEAGISALHSAPKAYEEGADYALYELCKELDIGSQDIRKSDDTIDGKTARLAQRIIYMFCNNTDEMAPQPLCQDALSVREGNPVWFVGKNSGGWWRILCGQDDNAQYFQDGGFARLDQQGITWWAYDRKPKEITP